MLFGTWKTNKRETEREREKGKSNCWVSQLDCVFAR